MRIHALALAATALVFCNGLHAQDVPEWIPPTDTTANQSGGADAKGRSLRRLIEVALDRHHGRNGAESWSHGDLGVDAQYTRNINGKWRAVGGGRFDYDAYPQREQRPAHAASVSLREAYLSRSGPTGSLLHIGRINIRDGVALGFNPTDVFRRGSLPVRRTEDPERLRESRLGVVALGAQLPLGQGSVAVVVAPEIDDASDPAWYDAQLGATNSSGQAYLRVTAPTWSGVYSNAVMHARKDGERTLGFNLNRNIGHAGTAYLEFARARREPLTAIIDPVPPTLRWANQWSLGATYATESGFTFGLEHQYNGFGLDADDWRRLWSQGGPLQVGGLFGKAAQLQDPLSRHSWLATIRRDPFGGGKSQFGCLLRMNYLDRSRFAWCEWGYQLQAADLAVQLGNSRGERDSEFGASGSDWSLGVILRFYP